MYYWKLACLVTTQEYIFFFLVQNFFFTCITVAFKSIAKVFSQVYNNIISYFLFLSLRFIFFFVVLHYQISSKGIASHRRDFFCCGNMADKKILALKLMARFSVHKRGSNEDPGTNGSIAAQWAITQKKSEVWHGNVLFTA